MASCHNCNNLLPRTVDRCPVCGVVPPSEPTPIAEVNNTPGWKPDTGAQSPAAKARETQGHPSEFRSPAGGVPPAAPQPPDALSTSPGVRRKRAFTPPPLPGDQPTAIADTSVPAPNAWGGAGDERLPARSESGELLDERSVKSMSSRVEGSIVTGRKTNHHVAIVAAVVAGIVSLGIGSWAGLASYNATGDSLAYADEGGVDSARAASWLDDNGEAFVSITIDGCLGRQTHPAIAVDSRSVLVTGSKVESDPSVAVIDNQGTTRSGRILAIDASRDLAIIRLTDPLTNSTAWGSTQRVVGQSVDVIAIDQAQRTDEDRTVANRITDVVQRGNEVIGFTLEFEVSPGSIVIDSNGFLIGIVGASGVNATTAEELNTFISASVLNPENPGPVCPAPPTTLPTDGGATGDTVDDLEGEN